MPIFILHILTFIEYVLFYLLAIILTSVINRGLPEDFVLAFTRLMLKTNLDSKKMNRIFKVKLWKHKLPQLSKVDKTVYDKSRVGYGYQDLLDYKLSLEKGIFAHTNPLLLLVIILIFASKSVEIVLLNAALMIIGQIPFVVVQLYNYYRINHLILEKEEQKKKKAIT